MFYTILPANLKGDGFMFHEGLIRDYDSHKFAVGGLDDFRPWHHSYGTPDCLWFTDEKNILKYLSEGTLIADVELPKGAQLKSEQYDSNFNITDAYILKNIRPLADYIESLPKESLLKLVRENAHRILPFIKVQTPEICLEAVKHGASLKDVKVQTPELCLEAIKMRPDALADVINQTEELCLEAVKRNGMALYKVRKQTDAICLEAVKQWGSVLSIVKHQTPELCEEAVEQSDYAFRYVQNQTPELCAKALKRDVSNLEYVKNQTPEMCLNAVRKNGENLRYVKNKTLELCREAMKERRSAIEYVPSELLSGVWDLK